MLCCLVNVIHAQPPRDISFSSVAPIKLWDAWKKQETTINNSTKMKLLVLLSPECPMSVNYTLTLNQINEKFREQLDITGIIPGRTWKDETVIRFSSDHKLEYPLLVDKELWITRMIKGEVTPEVFLFNAEGELVYSGAIDNWLTELGKKKQKPDAFYLRDAIEATQTGMPVRVRYVKAQGCLVNDY